MDFQENYDLLSQELQFFYIIQDIYTEISKVLGTFVERHVRRALAEWYFMLQQDFNDPFLLDREGALQHEANQKLMKTIGEIEIVKSFPIPFDQFLWDSIEIARRNNSLVLPRVSWNEAQQKIQITDKFSILHERLGPLRNKFQCNDVLLARAALTSRNHLLNYSGFCSEERREVIDLLYKSFDVRFEGFARVIDSVLLYYKDTKWCSMFEMDKQFQSLGNFFHLDLSKQEFQGCWFLNPPFVESIVDDVAFKVLHSLRFGRVESCFFIAMPNWDDTWAWKNLLNSRFFLAAIYDVPVITHIAIKGRVNATKSKHALRRFIVLGHPKFARDDFDRIESLLKM